MITRLINLFNYLRLIFIKRKYYSLSIDGYLHDNGFFQSSESKGILFKDGSFSPWLTYPFLSFFIPKIRDSYKIFEYGSGYSTLFFQEKNIECYSIEDNLEWYNKIRLKLIYSERLFFEEEKTKYLDAIKIPKTYFDIVLIDGNYRNECAELAVAFLKKDGVIILDNSERFLSAKENLLSSGFKVIDFYGLQSLGYQTTVTSIFYKDGNIIGI